MLLSWLTLLSAHFAFSLYFLCHFFFLAREGNYSSDTWFIRSFALSGDLLPPTVSDATCQGSWGTGMGRESIIVPMARLHFWCKPRNDTTTLVQHSRIHPVLYDKTREDPNMSQWCGDVTSRFVLRSDITLSVQCHPPVPSSLLSCQLPANGWQSYRISFNQNT